MGRLTPEQQAREQIDHQLEEAGWQVQNYREMNISAGLGIAVREFRLKSGSADYMLYADGKAIGVVEAKPEGHPLSGVELQSKKYTDGLPAGLPYYRLPLPFAYESTGTVTQFTNSLEPDARSREVFTFHQPSELIRLANLDNQVRTLLRKMPPLDVGQLWKVQVASIQNLEKSLAQNRPRSLIQMATGSGKTFTAVNFCYRLIKFAKAKRILFLVDRNNLGRQTLNEFQQFVSPVSNYKFTEEYGVQHLKRNTIDPAAKVCITTIQRLYSMLKGEEEFLEENEEGSLFEAESSLIKEPLPVVYNAKIPIETFDFIVVDECHRSIYNVWRQVLEYFDAFIIGLTATPSKQTIGFFNGNLVQDYTHEQAVVDGVNVGYDVYRIETAITKDGATLIREPGIFVPHRDRRTKEKKFKELDEDLTYTANQLNLRCGSREPDPPGHPHVQGEVARDFPRSHRGSQNPCVRQDRFARRRHRAGYSRRVRQGERLLPENHVEKHWQETRRTSGRLPQLLQSSHRRHRGHDCHRNGRKAARMSAVHAEHSVHHVL